MLKIKLTKIGKKHQPFFRIVVAEARSKRNGKFLDFLGTYNPISKLKKVKINRQSFEKWIAKGAQPTKKVKKLYEKTN